MSLGDSEVARAIEVRKLGSFEPAEAGVSAETDLCVIGDRFGYGLGEVLKLLLLSKVDELVE